MRKIKKIKRKEVIKMADNNNDNLATFALVAGTVIGGIIAISLLSSGIAWLVSGPVSGPIIAAAAALKSQGK